LSHSTSPIFAMGFFELGSQELFALTGFELWSSWVARITEVSHQHPAVCVHLSLSKISTTNKS
jgi:hypothetical protein